MVTPRYIRLQQWARQYGISRVTVWRTFRDETLPPELKAHKVGSIVYVLTNPDAKFGRAVGYARVSSADQKSQLEPQANRLRAWAAQKRITLDTVIQETASGMNDKGPP